MFPAVKTGRPSLEALEVIKHFKSDFWTTMANLESNLGMSRDTILEHLDLGGAGVKRSDSSWNLFQQLAEDYFEKERLPLPSGKKILSLQHS